MDIVDNMDAWEAWENMLIKLRRDILREGEEFTGVNRAVLSYFNRGANLTLDNALMERIEYHENRI